MLKTWFPASALLILSVVAALAQQPTLPPPGSLTTPPAAPNPLTPANPPASPAPAPEAPQPQPPGTPPQTSDQVKPTEISGPTDVVLESKPAIILRGQSTWDDGYENLMEAFAKLRAEASRLKVTSASRPQAAFMSTDDFGFKYEAMILLDAGTATPLAGLGKDFVSAPSPSGKALKFTHIGAYDDIDTTYEAITAYLDEKGLKARNIFIEEYMNDPKSSEDTTLEMNIYVLVE
ncbi:MAG: GyrI-like domain-containing protein [Beijerinckiaceae bacterium]